MALLADDAIAISDGAGLTETLLRYDSAQHIAVVARAGFQPTPAKRRLAGGTPAVHYALVNGSPAILFVVDDKVVGAVTFDLANGRIVTVRGIAAPARLPPNTAVAGPMGVTGKPVTVGASLIARMSATREDSQAFTGALFSPAGWLPRR